MTMDTNFPGIRNDRHSLVQNPINLSAFFHAPPLDAIPQLDVNNE